MTGGTGKARERRTSRCGACGHVEPRWVGRCPQCQAWGTMSDEAPTPAAGLARADAPARPARPIAAVGTDDHRRAASGIAELDRVLGGGLVPGAVVLLGGEPGAGKSTLLLQAAHALTAGERRVLYVSAEESPGQVRLRADRLGTLSPQLWLASETDLPAVLGHVEQQQPDVLVVDSVQTIRHPDVAGTAGGVAQVRECAAALVSVAKQRRMATVLVGHVTKDGQLAGPRVLEHVVDVVLDLSGDRHHALRLLRATKNRHGAVGEVGCFAMDADGMIGVPDAGRLFVGDVAEGTAGVALTVVVEGRRPLACEVQALVTGSTLASPRRVASGLDAQRLALLVAVLHRRVRLGLADCDVYASSVGGVRLSEPAVDLALCLAIASSKRDNPVGRDMVAVGEVGLAGEVRLVPQMQARLAEAARLGFRRAGVAAAYDGPACGLRLHRVRDLSQALAALLG